MSRGQFWIALQPGGELGDILRLRSSGGEGLEAGKHWKPARRLRRATTLMTCPTSEGMPKPQPPCHTVLQIAKSDLSSV